MIYSLNGKIVEIGDGWVAIDLGNIAYEVLVSRTSDFALEETSLIYTYEALTQEDHYLVGFKDKMEKMAFASLITVKGIGPKTALSALSSSTPKDLFQAIETNNTAYLKKLPGIGPKAAAQIILDLKGKLVKTDEKGHPERYPGVAAALKSLNFKKAEIEQAIASIKVDSLTEEEATRMALRYLRKK